MAKAGPDVAKQEGRSDDVMDKVNWKPGKNKPNAKPKKSPGPGKTFGKSGK